MSKRFLLVGATSGKTLAENVQNFLNQGWDLYGYLVNGSTGDDCTYLYQAMTREDDLPPSDAGPFNHLPAVGSSRR